MATKNAFGKWLDTFLTEKKIDLDQILTVEGPSGANHIPVECLVEMMNRTSSREQSEIQAMIIKIDHANGDVLPFFAHLAKAIAK